MQLGGRLQHLRQPKNILASDQATSQTIGRVPQRHMEHPTTRLSLDLHLRVTLALPISPCVEKRTPSFVTPISTVSPMVDRSLQTEPPVDNKAKNETVKCSAFCGPGAHAHISRLKHVDRTCILSRSTSLAAAQC